MSSYVYSDTANIVPTREQQMEAAFRRWKKNLGPKWSLIAPHVVRGANDGGIWGLALFRYDYRSPTRRDLGEI